ncbi:MAG: hypothetical protein M5U34_17835 [Chloroflexi bacterium]|nr:hypothetical protein [Chloroflexota bacterium]
MATRVPFANTQAIMKRYLDDFLLVDDAGYQVCHRDLVGTYPQYCRRGWRCFTAAAIQNRERFAGKKIVLVMSGGNLAVEKLKAILGD